MCPAVSASPTPTLCTPCTGQAGAGLLQPSGAADSHLGRACGRLPAGPQGQHAAAGGAVSEPPRLPPQGPGAPQRGGLWAQSGAATRGPPSVLVPACSKVPMPHPPPLALGLCYALPVCCLCCFPPVWCLGHLSLVRWLCAPLSFPMHSCALLP